MQTDVNKRNIGINFNQNNQAVVNIWAPLADSVELNINENKKIALTKNNRGYWHAETDEIKPGDLFTVNINGEGNFPDPTSLHQPQGVHGPSMAVDLNKYNWDDSNWNNPDLEKYIIYELHTGTFTDGGTFKSLEEKLDYLADLGITAIEIMPVAQFPGGRNWGYDGVFPFAVQDTYGGYEGLRQLVQACHKKNIAVILDVVYNHLGPEGNYLGAFGPYFTSKYATPWGNAINFDDAWCDGVREYFIENALMWFRDFHIDALRLDAVHAIKDFSPNHLLREIKQKVNELMAVTGRRHYLIVELDLNDNRFINPLSEHGFGMDAQWIDEFHHALRVTAGGEKTGYYADFDGIEHLAKSYRDAYVFDGQFSEHRKRVFGVKAENNPGKQFIVFSQNHDQVGNRMLGERTSQLVSYEMQKLLAAAVMAAPYLPMLFMGEEYSEPNPFLYFVSHTDPELAEAVRKGRKEEFEAFHASGEAPDPVDEATFNQSKLQWHLVKENKHQVMFNYYKHLISLRKENAVLNVLNRNCLNAQADKERQLLTLQRWNDSELWLCYMNFSSAEQSNQLPQHAHEWQLVLNSASTKWGGKTDSPHTVAGGTEINIQPESILIYKNSHE